MKFNEEILQKAIEHYSPLIQSLKLFEELSELQKAVCDLWFEKGDEEADKIAVKQEIADVLIMIEQLKMMTEISDEEVQEVIDYKLNRLNERIENELR